MRVTAWAQRAFRAACVASLVAVVGLVSTPRNSYALDGVTPDQYCFQSQCFASLGEAESAMRASTPLGQYLEHSDSATDASSGVESTTLNLLYTVKDYPAKKVLDAAYDSWPHVDTCQRPATTEGHTDKYFCLSEQEIYNATLQREAANGCTVVSPTLQGDFGPVTDTYSIETDPNFSNLALVREDQTQRAIRYEVQCSSTTFTNVEVPMYKSTVYQCTDGSKEKLNPAVTPNFSNIDQVQNPVLCFNQSQFTIVQKHPSQFSSCPASPYPCYPSTGDKARAEVDFVFAGRPFTRYYHSLNESRLAPTFAQGWSHTFQSRVWGSSLIREDGNFYPLGGTSASPSVYNAAGIKFNVDMQTYSFTTSTPEGDVEKYSMMAYGGRLQSIENAANPERSAYLYYKSIPNATLVKSQVLDYIQDIHGRTLKFNYNNSQQLESITLPDGKLIKYGYDSDFNLTSVDYGNGQIKQYLYGETGLAPASGKHYLTGIISEDGQRYGTFTYDQYGRVTDSKLNTTTGFTETTHVAYPSTDHALVTTRQGDTVDYQYTGFFRKPQSIQTAGGTDQYQYDSSGNTIQSTDARGVVTATTYNAIGQVTALVEAAGDTTGKTRTTQTDWHATFNAPIERRVLDSNNTLVAKETWTYNTRGQVLTHSFIDPATNATRTTTNTYCENTSSCGGVGLILSVDGPRTDANDITTYSYYLSDDPTCATAPTACPHRKGDLWTVTNALGQVNETLAYDGAGRVLSVKDPNGVITDFTYTPRGWLASKTIRGSGAGADRQTRIEYWPTGLVSFVYQPDNSFTAFTYDGAHRLTDVFDNAGNAIHYTLDNAGNKTKEDTKDPNGTPTRTLSRVYNQLGQLQQSLTANNHATTYAYDGAGNIIGISDALGRNSGNAYDPLGRLAATLQDSAGINATTQFAYDANDRLTQVIDPKGLATNYSYNGLGDLTQLISPDTGTTNYTYDAAGNRLSQTDARGVTANSAYDALNRLMAVSYSDSTYNQSYTYDAAQGICPAGEQTTKGFLTAMQSKGATTQYCYDHWGQLVRKVQTVGSLTQVTRYLYDVYGRLQGLIYPDGGAVDYLWNTLGQITEVGYIPPNGSRSVVATGVTYAPFGQTTGWTYGNGRTFSRTLTLDYRPNAIQDNQSGGLSYAYGFDAVGNLGALKDGTQTTDLGKFVYDGLNRLTQQQNGLGSPLYTWDYDAIGNRTQAQSVINGTQTYTYTTNSHHLNQVGVATRSYDAAGNTTDTGAGKTFGYGPDNRMGSVQTGTGSLQYAYDARGQQVLRQSAGATSVYAYDESGHWLGEYTAAGDAKQQVIWLDDLPVGVVTAVNNAPTLAYIESDHLGTPRAIIDPTRNVAIWSWPLTTEAFGNEQPDQDPDGDGILFAFDLRFPGQRYDNVTALNQNWNRDYDASSGRYVESDPLGITADLSTYGYVDQTPLIAYDPNGLKLRDLNSGGKRRNLSRSQLENEMSGSPLSRDIKNNLDRGCIGLVSTYQGKSRQWPEEDPNTLCFSDLAEAVAASNCSNPFIFAKQGQWANGAPHATAEGRVPSNAISNAGGHYNYVAYFPATASFVWMNWAKKYEGVSGPQRGSIAPYAPKDSNYPQSIWCMTCR